MSTELLRYRDESLKLNCNEETWKLVEHARSEKELGFMSNTLVIPMFPMKRVISPWSSEATSIAHVCGLEGYMLRELRGVICFL